MRTKPMRRSSLRRPTRVSSELVALLPCIAVIATRCKRSGLLAGCKELSTELNGTSFGKNNRSEQSIRDFGFALRPLSLTTRFPLVLLFVLRFGVFLLSAFDFFFFFISLLDIREFLLSSFPLVPKATAWVPRKTSSASGPLPRPMSSWTTFAFPERIFSERKARDSRLP